MNDIRHSDLRRRISDQGFTLPAAPDPVGSYVPGVVQNGTGWLSGQFPMVNGELSVTGRVGLDLDADEGTEAARVAALNVLAQMNRLLNGRLPRRLLRVDGYVASAPDFTDQPDVLDGASDLFVGVLGERGTHARTAFAVPQLPLNATVELVVTFAVEEGHSS